jgi:hypothetical protein
LEDREGDGKVGKFKIYLKETDYENRRWMEVTQDRVEDSGSATAVLSAYYNQNHFKEAPLIIVKTNAEIMKPCFGL